MKNIINNKNLTKELIVIILKFALWINILDQEN